MLLSVIVFGDPFAFGKPFDVWLDHDEGGIWLAVAGDEVALGGVGLGELVPAAAGGWGGKDDDVDGPGLEGEVVDVGGAQEAGALAGVVPTLGGRHGLLPLVWPNGELEEERRKRKQERKKEREE